jgi:hypothetical protein
MKFRFPAVFVLDTWDNGCGANPELQIFSGVGYNECIAGIVKLTILRPFAVPGIPIPPPATKPAGGT